MKKYTGKSKFQKIKENSVPYLLVLPAFAFVAFILWFSVIYGIRMSFYQIELGIPGEPFVGLDNWVNLFGESRFQNSFKLSLIFVAGSVGLGFLLSFSFALGLKKVKLFSVGFQGLALIPYLVSGIATAIIYRFLFARGVGFVNQILLILGVGRIEFLSVPHLAMIVAILANVWFIVPFSTLILLGGLQSIDPNLIEAAIVNGATKMDILRKITIPLIKPMIGIAMVWMSFASFNMFDVILPLTGGGPGRATEVLALYMYRLGFDSLRYSDGAVVMGVILIANVITSVVFLRIFRSEV
ncbi:carbohydrate ABC transporter permease [Halarsenatibacter silvermanii]|uniref:Carbohydrate ABC transporter membrane protein 1, CUT1 family n=1 Tax=Halarsenatibacter silvermanii TaxID=321763 RepID=A0A1G9LYJ9_9FIRM|nr:sugar ABC transporter permease [Halarsenatibacter silvermanii]SDL66954.1 carbohydrate ABC transporter membrane protein 1, CUT1 family [Halarsenatibacter silvermanii]